MPRSPPSKACWPALLPLAALALLLAGAAGVSGQALPPIDVAPPAPLPLPLPLPPFSRVVSCLPFSLLIRPSNSDSSSSPPATDEGGPSPSPPVMAFADGGKRTQAPAAGQPAGAGGGRLPYSLLLGTTDPNITAAFQHRVSPDGTLYVGLSTAINTTACASLVLELPAGALREVRGRVGASGAALLWLPCMLASGLGSVGEVAKQGIRGAQVAEAPHFTELNPICQLVNPSSSAGSCYAGPIPGPLWRLPVSHPWCSGTSCHHRRCAHAHAVQYATMWLSRMSTCGHDRRHRDHPLPLACVGPP